MIIGVEKEGYSINLKWGEAVELNRQILTIPPEHRPLKLVQLQLELARAMDAATDVRKDKGQIPAARVSRFFR